MVPEMDAELWSTLFSFLDLPHPPPPTQVEVITLFLVFLIQMLYFLPVHQSVFSERMVAAYLLESTLTCILV